MHISGASNWEIKVDETSIDPLFSSERDREAARPGTDLAQGPRARRGAEPMAY
jgi:hypothetical protein